MKNYVLILLSVYILFFSACDSIFNDPPEIKYRLIEMVYGPDSLSYSSKYSYAYDGDKLVGNVFYLKSLDGQWEEFSKGDIIYEEDTAIFSSYRLDSETWSLGFGLKYIIKEGLVTEQVYCNSVDGVLSPHTWHRYDYSEENLIKWTYGNVNPYDIDGMEEYYYDESGITELLGSFMYENVWESKSWYLFNYEDGNLAEVIYQRMNFEDEWEMRSKNIYFYIDNKIDRIEKHNWSATENDWQFDSAILEYCVYNSDGLLIERRYNGRSFSYKYEIGDGNEELFRHYAIIDVYNIPGQ